MKARFSTAFVMLLVMVLLITSTGKIAQAAPYPVTAQASLSQAETDGLLYMREEEKLAHDVYVVMYAKWRLATFSNISSAETNHMSAVKTLLDRYGLADPVKSNSVGVFTNPNLQSLYNTLIARGNGSLVEALKVGGAIEEIDILDLEKYIAQTSRTDIINVYTNIKSGSYNHLRAFSSQYQRKTGQAYQPQYLSPEVYQAIINGTY